MTEDLLSILHLFSERNNDFKKYKTKEETEDKVIPHLFFMNILLLSLL